MSVLIFEIIASAVTIYFLFNEHILINFENKLKNKIKKIWEAIR